MVALDWPPHVRRTVVNGAVPAAAVAASAVLLLWHVCSRALRRRIAPHSAGAVDRSEDAAVLKAAARVPTLTGFTRRFGRAVARACGALAEAALPDFPGLPDLPALPD